MSQLLKGKKILLGVSGGIAAYKICELVRLFKKSEAEVRVIMTPSALNFVSPVTLSALSGNEVLVNMFPETDPDKITAVETKTWHVYTGLWADVFLIAPATANTVAKLANGLSDNFLTATVLSSRCPVIVSPTMDEDMYRNEITTSNITRIRESGYWVIPPVIGELASGLVGVGRMPEPQSLFDYTVNFLNGHKFDLYGKKVLITAGPTYEPIDDVRFVGNQSTGKMGFALAKAASQRGAEVTLISGPTMLQTPRNINRIDVTTAEEMFSAVDREYLGQDFIIMSAAVADYRPKSRFRGKIKKTDDDTMTLVLSRTTDILEHLGRNKRGFKLIGFALETENEIDYAMDKIRRKNLDLIVVNNPRNYGAGFGTETNVVTLIDSTGKQNIYKKMHKFDASNLILDRALTL